MKKVKDWLPEHYNIAQGTDIAIILYDVWDKMAETIEAAQKMIDDEMDDYAGAVEYYNKHGKPRDQDVILKEENKKKVKEWLGENYNTEFKSILPIQLWENSAESIEAALKMVDDEIDKYNQEVEIYKEGNREFELEQKAQEYINKAIISKGKSRRKSSPKVFGD